MKIWKNLHVFLKPVLSNQKQLLKLPVLLYPPRTPHFWNNYLDNSISIRAKSQACFKDGATNNAASKIDFLNRRLAPNQKIEMLIIVLNNYLSCVFTFQANFLMYPNV